MIIYDNAVSFIQMVKVSYCSIQSIDFRLLEKSMHLCISACVYVCVCMCVCVCVYVCVCTILNPVSLLF